MTLVGKWVTNGSTVPDDAAGDDAPYRKAAGSAAVMALFDGEVHVALLAPSRPVVLGRAPTASGCVGLCVRDGRLSRNHVRFTLGATGVVHAEDLGSRNGTWLGSERIQRIDLRAGQGVRAGGVSASVHVFEGPRILRAAEPRPDDIVVADSPLRAALEAAERAARSRLPVLLLGETGSGKELVARRIHDLGARSGAPLVLVNCGAIPAQLAESALFGHERGAFTGAFARQAGFFAEADGGTIVLDEVGELPPSAQAALLRVLETGVFRRVGASRDTSVRVRVIAATHRDLPAMSETGAFRRDLYYRLGALTVRLPPLRERPGDIAPLAAHFLRRACAAGGLAVPSIDPAALARLERHDWPGNVRELKHAIERALVVGAGTLVLEEHLPESVRASGTSPTPVTAAASLRWTDLRDAKRTEEAGVLRAALERAGWKRSDAARELGIPLRTLAYKIKTLGIERG